MGKLTKLSNSKGRRTHFLATDICETGIDLSVGFETRKIFNLQLLTGKLKNDSFRLNNKKYKIPIKNILASLSTNSIVPTPPSFSNMQLSPIFAENL